MPDLDKAAVEQWLRTNDPDVADQTASADIQADDMPGVLSEMIRLGHALDRAVANDPDKLSAFLLQPEARSGMRAVLGHASTARRVSLLSWFATSALPNRNLVMNELLADEPDAAREADAGHVARESIRNLNRSTLLARLFSPQRVARLLSTCTNQEDLACDA